MGLSGQSLGAAGFGASGSGFKGVQGVGVWDSG